MGDMRDIFDAMKEYSKEKRNERNNKYEPMLIELGAVKKSNGVYMFNDYLCYPTKGFVMHKRTYKKQGLEKFINKMRGVKCQK